MTRVMPFTCSICEEESTHICLSCTKDTCGNHLCEKCDNCSDCCTCELTLEHTAAPERPLVYKPIDNSEEEFE